METCGWVSLRSKSFAMVHITLIVGTGTITYHLMSPIPEAIQRIEDDLQVGEW